MNNQTLGVLKRANFKLLKGFVDSFTSIKVNEVSLSEKYFQGAFQNGVRKCFEFEGSFKVVTTKEDRIIQITSLRVFIGDTSYNILNPETISTSITEELQEQIASHVFDDSVIVDVPCCDSIMDYSFDELF